MNCAQVLWTHQHRPQWSQRPSRSQGDVLRRWWIVSLFIGLYLLGTAQAAKLTQTQLAAVATLAEFTSKFSEGDPIDQVLSSCGFDEQTRGMVPNWSHRSAIEKLKYAVAAANSVSAKNGERLVAKLAAQVAQDSPTVAKERPLKRFLAMNVGIDVKVEFPEHVLTAQAVQATKLGPDMDAALHSLATYVEQARPGSLTMHKLCAAAAVRCDLVEAKSKAPMSTRDILAEAISHCVESCLRKMVVAAGEHYPTVKEDPSIKALMSEDPELRKLLMTRRGARAGAQASRPPPLKPPPAPQSSPEPDGDESGSCIRINAIRNPH